MKTVKSNFDMTYDNLDIVFLGGLFPKETENTIIADSIGSIDNAANNLQWKFVNGFDDNLKRSVKIINSLYIGSYPSRYRKSVITNYEFYHVEGSSDINVGFINLAGIKHLSKFLSLRPHLHKWATNKTDKTKCIIAYALTSIFVELLCYVKHLNPDIITIIIVPDLPQYMDMGISSKNRRLLYDLFKSISTNHIKHKISNIDGFVLLTKHMIDALAICDKETVIIEGIASQPSETIDSNATDRKHVRIVYTGALNARYGIVDLINAFMKIGSSNYKLILCGAGDSVSFIENAARIDNRIIYLGQLKRDDINKLQNSATILVNPRQNNEEFTKYSFPSKIMEYLSSGTPVIAYKLDGMPDEYDNFIHYVADNSIGALKNKLMEVAEQPSEIRQRFGESAKNWVTQQKNRTIQAAKVLDMIINISKKT